MKQFFQINSYSIISITLLLFLAITTKAQVGIGIANPAASAQLDVSSTSKGFLPPRMTQTERNAIPSPVPGLMIWCKDCGVLGEVQVYNGGIWTNMMGGYPADPVPPTVTIGTQEWMTKNLDVVTYRNGDTIPEVTDPAVWASLTTGAWCYYDNDPANGFVYGRLYNRYAVVDPRGLAPTGWRVPSNSDWETLSGSLGGQAVAAGKMRATIIWNSLYTGSTNESGFTGLPGGRREEDGTFNNIGKGGIWWSQTSYEQYALGQWVLWNYAYTLSQDFIIGLINAGYGIINRSTFPQTSQFFPDPVQYGFSVRCIRE
jgi:uncharacterized protein (TIGR02145 family)